MSTKPRKQAGSFVSDPSAINLIQLTPRADLYHMERSPFTMANHNSKTNFIGDTVIAEGPRAVAVSETGEKHSIELEDDPLKSLTASITHLNVNTNPFSGGLTQPLSPTTTPHNPLTPRVLNSSERHKHSSRRSKGSRHYVNQKPRPVFTPRHTARLTPRYVTEAESQKVHTPISNAQTQTDNFSPKPSRVYQTLRTPSLSPSPSPPRPQPPSVPPLSRKYTRESVGDMADTPRHRQPLRVFPRKKTTPLRSYTGTNKPLEVVECPTYTSTNFLIELRNIVSALTLITVVSWLFSTFFELDGLVEMVTSLVQYLNAWYYQRRQPPMTKAEMMVQYFRDFWS